MAAVREIPERAAFRFAAGSGAAGSVICSHVLPAMVALRVVQRMWKSRFVASSSHGGGGWYLQSCHQKQDASGPSHHSIATAPLGWLARSSDLRSRVSERDGGRMTDVE